MTPPVAVIGAGYAGMAAAVELAAAGRRVHVLEASRTLGGRARGARLPGTDGLEVDNGEHLIVGAYVETLRLMRRVGADPEHLFKRGPLHLEVAGEFRMRAPRLPAPLHTAAALLGARGLDWREKFAAVRLMQRLQRNRFRIEPDLPFTDWLARQGAPSRQVRLLWKPLCVAALNTEAERASAQVMANVLRDSLAAAREASDFLQPQVDLSRLFPEPAARFVAECGGEIRRGQRVPALTREGDAWRLGDAGNFAEVVIAVPPYHLAALCPPLAPAVAHFEWEPIVTIYLRYPPQARLPQDMLGIDGGLAQWIFDRGRLRGQHGLISAVISARGPHLALPVNELERRIDQEIRRAVPTLPSLIAAHTIHEKRATFACLPSLRRPPTGSGLPGLWLAGDYVAGDYPATIEGAVRSGVAAARAVLAG